MDAGDITRRRALLGGLSLLTLSACSMGNFDLGNLGGPKPPGDLGGNLPSMQGQTIGDGPVRVALLLPLSGDASLTKAATSPMTMRLPSGVSDRCGVRVAAKSGLA